jgi:Protein of unknown function with PCYCGC motif
MKKQLIRFLFGTCLVVSGLGLAALSSTPPPGPLSSSQKNSAQPKQNRDFPAYHPAPPSGSVPATQDPSQFRKDPSAFVAYEVASQIRELLYQEPCFCPCDKEEGHQSLLDCFTTRHASWCETCKQEVFLCYEQNRSGKSAAEIRNAIANGAWTKVDIAKYSDEYLAKKRQLRQ